MQKISSKLQVFLQKRPLCLLGHLCASSCQRGFRLKGSLGGACKQPHGQQQVCCPSVPQHMPSWACVQRACATLPAGGGGYRLSTAARRWLWWRPAEFSGDGIFRRASVPSKFMGCNRERHAYALERFLAAACLCKAGGVHFIQCYAWACRWRQLGAFGLIFVVRKTRVCACVGVCARVCSNVLGGGPVAVEPTCLVASLATRLCTRMVFVSPSATHGQASGAAWAAALLPWG